MAPCTSAMALVLGILWGDSVVGMPCQRSINVNLMPLSTKILRYPQKVQKFDPFGRRLGQKKEFIVQATTDVDRDTEAVQRAAGTTGFGSVFGVDDKVLAEIFLKDRRGDVEEASFRLRNAVEWRGNFGETPIPKARFIEEELGSEKCYLHQHLDKQGRPVVVVRVQRHIIGEYPMDSSKSLCVSVIERALDQHPEVDGQLSFLLDLRGFGMRNADFRFVKFLVKTLYYYYPGRLGNVYLVDAPLIFQGPWQVVKPWLRRYAELVKFVSYSKLENLFVSAEQAPKL